MNAGTPPSVELQCAEGIAPPADAPVEQWIAATLARVPHARAGNVALRLVAADESEALNSRYRGRKAPTNVLAFPPDLPPGLPPDAANLLGDLVICIPVLLSEAGAQGKTPLAHFAHLVVHGTLHLAGLDHEDDEQAVHMETLEREILRDLGFADPYRAVRD